MNYGLCFPNHVGCSCPVPPLISCSFTPPLPSISAGFWGSSVLSDKSMWPQLLLGNESFNFFLFFLENGVLLFLWTSSSHLPFTSDLVCLVCCVVSCVLLWWVDKKIQLSKLSRDLSYTSTLPAHERWSGGNGVSIFLQDTTSYVVKLLLDDVSICFFHSSYREEKRWYSCCIFQKQWQSGCTGKTCRETKDVPYALRTMIFYGREKRRRKEDWTRA